MNAQAIRILILKDLFLSRWPLFGYFAAGFGCAIVSCSSNSTIAFTGSILVITIAIASGIHLIGNLLLSETIDQTRLFIMSLPVSLLDYSIAKIAVVLTTYMIPWLGMLVCSIIFNFILPGGKPGAAAVIPAIFLFMLAGFTIQLVTAVISESVGWTICVLVGCNVVLNVFLMKLYNVPVIAEAAKSGEFTCPPLVLQVIAVELAVIGISIGIALFFQTRKRDLV